eukprot:7386419-Prymnesium_polylepis.1
MLALPLVATLGAPRPSEQARLTRPAEISTITAAGGKPISTSSSSRLPLAMFVYHKSGVEASADLVRAAWPREARDQKSLPSHLVPVALQMAALSEKARIEFASDPAEKRFHVPSGCCSLEFDKYDIVEQAGPDI